MGLFTKRDLERAEQDGSFVVKGRKEIGNMEIDLTIDRLFDVLFPVNEMEMLADLPQEKFAEYLRPTPMINGNFWLLSPNHHHIAVIREKVKKRKGLEAEIITRSSWARYGVYVAETDDELSRPDKEFEGNPFVKLNGVGTYAKLRPGDNVAKILARTPSAPVGNDELRYLIEKGIIRIEREGKVLGPRDVRIFDRHIVLTLDPRIRKYNGKLIDPRRPSDDCFEDITLEEKGLYGIAQEFFTSATAEKVWIGQCYAGFAKATKYGYLPHSDLIIVPDRRISVMHTHTNAPLIHPRSIFHGKITLENYAFTDYHLVPGMDVVLLRIDRLESPMLETKDSRYKGQEDSRSKGHIVKGQLEFDF
jgi:deoxycytidine triphosphate deaminase